MLIVFYLSCELLQDWTDFSLNDDEAGVPVPMLRLMSGCTGKRISRKLPKTRTLRNEAKSWWPLYEWIVCQMHDCWSTSLHKPVYYFWHGKFVKIVLSRFTSIIVRAGFPSRYMAAIKLFLFIWTRWLRICRLSFRKQDRKFHCRFFVWLLLSEIWEF